MGGVPTRTLLLLEMTPQRTDDGWQNNGLVTRRRTLALVSWQAPGPG